ncbi:hypothetical protein [Yersinia phage PY100]|nr:hypothetical protein [Yersinia phage PY100]
MTEKVRVYDAERISGEKFRINVYDRDGRLLRSFIEDRETHNHGKKGKTLSNRSV